MPQPYSLVVFLLFLGFFLSLSKAQTPAITSSPSSPDSTFHTSTTPVAITSNGCSLASSILSSCESASPGFSTFDRASRVACLCYNANHNYRPDPFNSAIVACADYVLTAEPTLYLLWSQLEGYCATISTTTSSSSLTNYSSATTPIVTATTTQSTTGSGSSLPSPTPKGSSGPIQNFTPGQIIGISVGCGLAAFLVGFGPISSTDTEAIFQLASANFNQEPIFINRPFLTRNAAISSISLAKVYIEADTCMNATLGWNSFMLYNYGTLGNCSDKTLEGLSVRATAPYLVSGELAGEWTMVSQNGTASTKNSPTSTAGGGSTATGTGTGSPTSTALGKSAARMVNVDGYIGLGLGVLVLLM